MGVDTRAMAFRPIDGSARTSEWIRIEVASATASESFGPQQHSRKKTHMLPQALAMWPCPKYQDPCLPTRQVDIAILEAFTLAEVQEIHSSHIFGLVKEEHPGGQDSSY